MISINENLRIKRLDLRNLTFEIRKENEKKKHTWYPQGYFPNLKSCVNKVGTICVDEEFKKFQDFINNFTIQSVDDTKVKKNWEYKNYLIEKNGTYGGYILKSAINQKNPINYPSRLLFALETIVELEFEKIDNSSVLSMKSVMQILSNIKDSIEKELKEIKE